MTWKRLWLLLAFAMVWHARDVGAQPAGRDPILRLNAGGPTGYVSGLALTDDGRTLYSVGFDQVVRVWSRNADGGYSLDPFAFRVPVGPGLRGALNTVAVSSDGRWLAAAGHGVVDTGFRQIGFVVPAVGMPPERYRDMGVIHVWDTRARTVRVLRGHTGPVFSLSFGPARGDKAPLLASGAQDYDLKSFQEQGAIKLWDPSAEVPEIASHDMPKLSHPRLNVAITETGADPKQTKVASAWGDGKTRIWDVAADKVSSFADGTVNIPLVRFPDRPKFLTAGVQGGQGSLRVWDAAPTESPAELAIYPVNHVPRALAIISSVPGGKPDHLATVLEGPARNDGTIPYQLQLTQLAGATPVRTVELWAGRRNWPAVVAAPQGQWLAVAGNDAHEIQMFNIKELLAGNAKPVSLRSVGAVYRHVAFVQSKDGMGLALSEAPKERPGAPARPPREGDHVLHLTKRQLSDDLAPWKLSTPDAGDWSTAITNPRPNEWAVSVREKGKERSLITLRRGQRVTEVALLPPGKWHKNPIVAVASETFLLPFLALYDGVTGDQFRLCTAHTDPIRALAFSPDGRLLASAAEDQTVCVWSLTNLEMILDKRGLLRGMPVKEDTGRLLLAKPDEERILAANQKALTDKAIVENDEIEGLVVGGELRRLQRVAAFYDAISRFAPGDKVTLRFRVRGDVALVVGQAIDERNPLFSLFVTREGRAERREWIGWSPNGPYEYSNRRAERWIGWHFNPVRLDTGATFDSPADQYHKEFFREGLLRHLVAQGAIAPALREWEKEDRARPLPQPVMRPWIDKTGPNTERAGAAVLVRDLPKTLRVLIGNFPPEKVGSLEWQVDNGPRRAFPPGDQAERTADVSGHAWKRGAAVIRVFLRTAHEEPREHVVELPIRYHPSPPILPAIAPADRRRVTDQDSFTLPLKLQPGDGRRPATVRFRVIRDGNEVAGAAKPAELALNEPSDVKPVFGLKPGPNRIEVVASNADAAGADLEWETAKLELLVEYQPKPVPRIDLESVVPLLDNDNTPGEPIVIGAASRVVVASSTVRVVGRVKASEAIADVRWVAGEGEGRRIAGFADGKPEQAINQTIVLKPGPTAIRITSRGASGGETTATIVIDYRPETPRAEITLPARGQLFFAGESNAETEVRGRVFPRDDAEPFETSVQVNDKSFPVKVDAATQEFVVTVPLVPGHNRISAKTTNKWGASRIGEPIEARYLRPPLVSPIAIPATSERPMVTLNAAVKSDLPLVPDSVEVTVNGRAVIAKVEVMPVAGEGDSNIRLIDVPLIVGENLIRVWVRNSDSRSRQAAEWKVIHRPAPQATPAPEVEFLSPAADARMVDPKITARLRVRTTTPLTQLELRRDGLVPMRVELPVAGGKPGADGSLEFSSNVELIAGPNTLRAVATNAGGQREVSIVVSYLPEPVEVVIEKIVPRGQADAALTPTLDADGRLVIARPSPSGLVTLHGAVYWNRPDDEQFKQVKEVRVFVNGFQQRPAELLPLRNVSGKRPERRFIIDLVLNRPTDNRIEVVLPGLKQRSASRREVAIDCAAPDPVRRLHVLPIVVKPRKAPATNDKQLRESLRGFFPTMTGAVREYPALTRYVSPQDMFSRLMDIKTELDLAAADGATNDLVVIYYQGGEAIEGTGHYLLTSVSEHDQDLTSSAISCEQLAEVFGQTLGAQVMLLDVNRRTGSSPSESERMRDGIAQWPDQPNLALVRYAHRQPTTPRLLNDLAVEFRQAKQLRDIVEHIRPKLLWVSDKSEFVLPDQRGTFVDWRMPTNLGGLPIRTRP